MVSEDDDGRSSEEIDAGSPRKLVKSSSKKRSTSANKSQSKARQTILNPKNTKYTGEGSGRKRCEIYKYFADDSARTKQKVDFVED